MNLQRKNTRGKSTKKKFVRSNLIMDPKYKTQNSKDYRFKQMIPYKIKPEPFPRVMYTRVKFADSYALSQTVVNTSVGWQFRLNSIYDPQASVGGNTVTGHAQLASIYSRYWVMGAKVVVNFTDPTADGLRVGCRLLIDGNTSAIGTTLTNILNKPLTYVSGCNNTGSQKKSFSFDISPWSLMGISKLEYISNSSTYSSAISANPAAATGCLFEIFAVDPVNNSNSIRADIKILYYTKFYGRITLEES